MRFVLLNESGVTDDQYGGALPFPILERIAAAIQVQLNCHVSTYWGGNFTVRAAKDATDLQVGEVVAVILDEVAAIGAVAYHDVSGAEAPCIFAARKMCNSILMGQHSLSVALSHELVETAGDPYCNAWRDDGQGFEYANELCDAVQDSCYVIDGVTVSDFVLPAFFAPGALGPYRFMAVQDQIQPDLTGSFATQSGGYQLRRITGTGEMQVDGTIPARKLAYAHTRSRLVRRGGIRVPA